jgi:hypothetical protein
MFARQNLGLPGGFQMDNLDFHHVISRALNDLTGGTARAMDRMSDEQRHMMTAVNRASGETVRIDQRGGGVLFVAGREHEYYLDIEDGEVTHVLDDIAELGPGDTEHPPADATSMGHLSEMLCDARRGLLDGTWARVDRLERVARTSGSERASDVSNMCLRCLS